MTERIRVTVVALIPAGVGSGEMQGFLGELSAQEGGSCLVTILKTPALPDGSRRNFAKISRVFPSGEANHRWHLRLTDQLYRAGFEEVAWRITEVERPGAEVEDTTSSLLPELFRDCLPPGIESRLVFEKPPASFGSPAFWEWVEKDRA